MKIVSLRKRELKKILKNNRVIESHPICLVNGEMYKFYYECLESLEKLSRSTGIVSETQIEWLDSKRYKVSSRLPNGVIKVDNYPVGVVYPFFFENYEPFTKLFQEKMDRIINNIRSSIIKNAELVENEIYNTDLSKNNILFRSTDVQLIDLDGKYIKNSRISSVEEVYSYYMKDIYKILVEKIKREYDEYESKKIIEYLSNLFNKINDKKESSIIGLIDDVQKLGLKK